MNYKNLFTAMLFSSLFFSLNLIYSTPKKSSGESLMASESNPAIRFVATAAIVRANYEKRKEQYTESLILLNELLKKHRIHLYLLESCEKGPTFLDTLCSSDGCTVLYTQTNNPKLSNYGINQALSLLTGLKHFEFDPNDMIIIFNGRYSLKTDAFIQFVENNPTADAIAKVWNTNDAYSALFAMKASFLFDFLEKYLDFVSMEKNLIPLEFCLGEFITKIRNQGANVIDLDIPKIYNLPIDRDYVSRFYRTNR